MKRVLPLGKLLWKFQDPLLVGGGGALYYILPRFRGVNLLYIAFFPGNSEGEIILFRHFFSGEKGGATSYVTLVPHIIEGLFPHGFVLVAF